MRGQRLGRRLIRTTIINDIICVRGSIPSRTSHSGIITETLSNAMWEISQNNSKLQLAALTLILPRLKIKLLELGLVAATESTRPGEFYLFCLKYEFSQPEWPADKFHLISYVNYTYELVFYFIINNFFMLEDWNPLGSIYRRLADKDEFLII